MSLNRHTILILMLTGSVGIPYISTTQLGQQAANSSETGETAGSAAGAGSSSLPSKTTATKVSSTYDGSAGYSGYGNSGSSSSGGSTYSGSTSTNATSGSSGSGYSGSGYGSSAAGGAAYGASGSGTTGSGSSTTGSAGYGSSASPSTAAGGNSPSTYSSGYSSGGATAGTLVSSTGPASASDERRGSPTTPGNEGGQSADSPHTLAEVMRFDITVPWIIAHWPRVSAGLSELDLHGYRVPLITGTGESDLAGSLTYYFNKKQQLDRIIFHGTSGDPRPLITIVTNQYKLERVIVDDPGLAFYQRKSWGKSHSELLIRPARVLRSNDPNKRYEIEMALKRP